MASGHPPKTSCQVTFNRSMTCSRRPKVIDCCPFSNRWSVDGGNPVFLENWAKVNSPRAFLRKTASFLSRLRVDTR